MGDSHPSAFGGGREAAVARQHHLAGRILSILGPGLISGAPNSDPSAVATYAVAGASLGFGTLWTAVATFPMMAGLQFVSAKVGLVIGMGLASVLRHHYPRMIVYPIILGLAVAVGAVVTWSK